MVLLRIDENWLDGELNGRRGILPDNYVEPIIQGDAQMFQGGGIGREQPDEQEGKVGPRARALYSYKSTSEEELSFQPGDIVMLTQRVDEDWLEGTLRGQTGCFPEQFVEIIENL